MAILNPSFLLALLVILYLFSLVLFAIVRIATGVSIQRLGYLSLRRISYTIRDGIRIEIRGLGLHLHRPTFARPTWISLRLTEIKITIEPESLAKGKGTENEELGRSRLWSRLMKAKEKIKAIHSKIDWLRMVDVEILNSVCVVAGVGSLQIASMSVAIDTRRKTVDRGRLFRHKKVMSNEQQPAEWMFVLKSVLFTAEGKESLEILDICSLNVHGLLYRDISGLRDASVSLKLGRIHIPYDDVIHCQNLINKKSGLQIPKQQETIVQTVSDAREFIASILRGIQEVQIAISFIGLSKQVTSVRPGNPLYLNFAMNEFGIDLFRLDPKGPAHRMYFNPQDVAHQALLAAISIGVSMDDGSGKPERLLYVPMATATIKTTLPSKTISSSIDSNAAERNANMLFANLVVTSPSVDVDLKHMSLVLALLRNHAETEKVKETTGRQFFLQLLPKASIKISIQEPVARVVLPPADPAAKEADDYDLLISSTSSVSLDLESLHSPTEDTRYSLVSNFRIASHHLYYQAANGDKHNLLLLDAFEVKTNLTATPKVSVEISGNLETFSIHLVRREITEGLYQIVQQLQRNQSPTDNISPPKQNFLRRVPRWLHHFYFKGSHLEAQVAGIDPNVSLDTRGIALQLGSWSTEYRSARIKSHHRTRSAQSASSPTAEESDGTDGRKLVIHAQSLEGHIVNNSGSWDQSFLSMPKFEISLIASRDSKGPTFNISSHLKAVYLEYSLYRYYSILVAYGVILRAFGGRLREETKSQGTDGDTIVIDIKAPLLRAKAYLPHDPPMMLQIYNFEGGLNRWTSPFAKTKLLRLYAEAPRLKRIWARIVSIKSARIDFRSSHRMMGRDIVSDKSFDISTEFIRLAVPHQLVLHKIIDNIINVIKATEQLNYRSKTHKDDYILRKPPQKAKVLPKISFKSKALMFELEDDPFEWKLSMIYRTGLIEQKQRLAREEAYHAKVKKIEEESQRRDSSRYRPQLSKPRGRDRQGKTPRTSISVEREPRSNSISPKGTRGQPIRYDTETKSGLTGSSRVSKEEAWLKLQEYNSTSWKKRITSALKFQTSTSKDIRNMFASNDVSPDSIDDTETILSLPNRPGLMTTVINDVHITLDKPTFAVNQCRDFLHRIGKGMPLDMEYSLLVPMHVQINMGETRVTLRNYPLPLLHIPAIRSEQSHRLPSWSVKTNFVIAEEFRDDESMRHICVQIIPPNKIDQPVQITKGFHVDVRRTASPVKTFSDVDISINTANPTTITWGTSYQPAIQDMMQIIESFTKPQVDPSERTGFWDKIRLILHSRVRVAWKGDGDVHLRLKGSRDPYNVVGHGAGFVMCFRHNVKWDIHQEDDPKKFMTVSCGDYILAIPDYSSQARESNRDQAVQENQSITSRHSQHNAIFKKVIMKLSGNVRWLAGLVFERNDDNGGRSFEFIPHYKVTLKTPSYAKETNGLPYDAFRGFRSHHIHLSVAVIAPVDRDWSVTNTQPSSGYNSMHMSPRFFTHFFDWWSLFSGVMSLPIRQGRLFPGLEKSNKKFGRHLATIKYNLLLSPFFISHVYKHKDAEDYAKEAVGATGLKLRIDSFMLDLHQRREEFATPSRGNIKATKTSGMRINKAQLDFISADVRAVSASIRGTSDEELQQATDEELITFHDQSYVSPDATRFTIPDNDTLWIDMDDFVELDWILPAETHPETKIMPLAYAPRFTYFRQTDHRESNVGSSEHISPFGDEPTHFCVMTEDNDPSRVQRDLISARIDNLQGELNDYQHTLDEYENSTPEQKEQKEAKDQYELLTQQYEITQQKVSFMKSMLKQINRHLKEHMSIDNTKTPMDPDGRRYSQRVQEQNFDPVDLASDFFNRFIVHNIQLKWSNALRNIILRYVHQVSQRRGFVYYMSRRAVKFILDILSEQQRNKERGASNSSHTTSAQPSPSVSFKDEINDFILEERIQELLKDGKNFVDANDPNPPAKSPRHVSGKMEDDLSEEYTAQNSYHVRLVAPQIQLQSEKNAKSVLLVTAREMQLKVIQIMDKDRLADNVSGLVQRRFSVDMDGVQFFVTNQKTLNKFIKFYGTNNYGSPSGSVWPPWAPIEVNFDFQLNPPGWFRVVQKTSASLRYDKYNTLRLKYNAEVSKTDQSSSKRIEDPESRIDHLWVEFPHIRAICDSTQYYTMYVIVQDLLLYSEPLEKTRNEKLEKIMLAADFSDLTGAPEKVTSLQERIRQLEEIKTHFQLNAKYLDRQGWQDRLAIERDLASFEDELFFLMKAITTSQRKYDERALDSQHHGLLRWYLSASEIVWHLMRDNNEPLMEIQLQHAAYDRIDNSDGSNHNIMEIERIHGLNLLPDAVYPEMIAPYFEEGATKSPNDSESIKMFRVQWHKLEAIAGIPVLDQFEVNLFPLRIQLEREVGQKVFEYIFPGNGDNAGRGASPFIIKQSIPNHDAESDANEDTDTYTLLPNNDAMDTTRAGSLELRLRPTFALSNTALEGKRPSTASTNGESRRFKFWQSSARSKSLSRTPPTASASIRSSSRRRSGESSRSRSRLMNEVAPSNVSTISGSTDRSRKFTLHRTASGDKHTGDSADALTEMLSRASNYMTLAYVKVPSVVLCLSYKGKGERNLEDVRDLVFRMPTIEYRNKTWSNLDLAMQLKKDVIRALISHAGAIIANKISHTRPSKNQSSRLREFANSSSLLPNTNSLSNALSKSASTGHNRSSSRDRAIAPNTGAFIAGWGQVKRTYSEASSLDDSMVSPGNTSGFVVAKGRDTNLDEMVSPRTRVNGTPHLREASSSTFATAKEDLDEEDDDILEMPISDSSTLQDSTRGRSGTIKPSKESNSEATGNKEDKPVIYIGKKLLGNVN
jgi:hypothetical protein